VKSKKKKKEIKYVKVNASKFHLFKGEGIHLSTGKKERVKEGVKKFGIAIVQVPLWRKWLARKPCRLKLRAFVPGPRSIPEVEGFFFKIFFFRASIHTHTHTHIYIGKK